MLTGFYIVNTGKAGNSSWIIVRFYWFIGLLVVGLLVYWFIG
jgi:hypothetical protein